MRPYFPDDDPQPSGKSEAEKVSTEKGNRRAEEVTHAGRRPKNKNKSVDTHPRPRKPSLLCFTVTTSR